MILRPVNLSISLYLFVFAKIKSDVFPSLLENIRSLGVGRYRRFGVRSVSIV